MHLVLCSPDRAYASECVRVLCAATLESRFLEYLSINPAVGGVVEQTLPEECVLPSLPPPAVPATFYCLTLRWGCLCRRRGVSIQALAVTEVPLRAGNTGRFQDVSALPFASGLNLTHAPHRRSLTSIKAVGHHCIVLSFSHFCLDCSENLPASAIEAAVDPSWGSLPRVSVQSALCPPRVMTMSF